MATVSDATIDQRIRSVTSLLRALNPQTLAEYTEIPDTDAPNKLEQLLNHLAWLFVIRHNGDVAAIAVKIQPEGVHVFETSTPSDGTSFHVTKHSSKDGGPTSCASI